MALGAFVHKILPTSHSKELLKVALFHFNKEAPLDITTQTAFQDYKDTWYKIFSYIQLLKKEKVDLIVLPEGIVPYSSESALLYRDEIPEEISHYAQTHNPLMSSREIAQALAFFWNSPLVMGMERRSAWQENTYYNSCFLFSPDQHLSFYDKQVLVPGGEYVPMEDFFKPILLQYGIVGSFKQGKGPVLLTTKKVSLFPLICYEETLSQYVLPAVSMNADLLIAISNDHWFPSTHFAREHWLLG